MQAAGLAFAFLGWTTSVLANTVPPMRSQKKHRGNLRRAGFAKTCSSAGYDAPDHDDLRSPVLGIAAHVDDRSRVRRVNDEAVSDVHPDVAWKVPLGIGAHDEHEVPRLEVRSGGHRRSCSDLRVRRTRKADARGRVGGLDKTRAV